MSLSVPNQGLLWCLLLFAIVAAIVHGFKLLVLGYRSTRKREDPRPEPEKEPVYYLVEKKKKKRSKTEYGEPKKIEFR